MTAEERRQQLSELLARRGFADLAVLVAELDVSESTVRRDFALGQRWARMLGFEIETPVLRQFGPEGEDHVGYVKFN